MPLSSLRGGCVEEWKAVHFFPTFSLAYPSFLLMSYFRTQRHNLSLAKKRLTKIWLNSLVKSPHTRIPTTWNTPRLVLFFPLSFFISRWSCSDRYIESFERKTTLPSIQLSHRQPFFFRIYLFRTLTKKVRCPFAHLTLLSLSLGIEN